MVAQLVDPPLERVLERFRVGAAGPAGVVLPLGGLVRLVVLEGKEGRKR